MIVVILSALAAGIGARGFGGHFAQVPAITVIALLAWAAWAFLTYQIGAKLLPGANTRVDVYELLRTIGFASAPGMLRIIGVVPVLTRPVFAVTTVWMLLSMVIAVRQALDYTSTARAVAVCVIGWALTLANHSDPRAVRHARTLLGMSPEATMIALKNILVATDFGHTAAPRSAYGRELARQYQGRLHVFHAVDDLHWRYSLDMSPGLLARDPGRARRKRSAAR